MALNHLATKNSEIPKIAVVHEDNPQWKSPAQLSPVKNLFRGKKVIFLVRDIRDVVVSLYFQKTRRDREYHGSLTSFLKEKVGSVHTIIAYYNIWAKNQNVPEKFLLVRYEDLTADPSTELKKVLAFLGYPNVGNELIQEAIEYASFERMHKMEGEGKFRPFDMKPGDPKDPESYKTRKGKVGGYRDYLAPEDISYLNQKISKELSDFFEYT
jgi:Sulfotransferase domain